MMLLTLQPVSDNYIILLGALGVIMGLSLLLVLMMILAPRSFSPGVTLQTGLQIPI